MCSHLETSRRTTSTSAFEFAALASNEGLDVASRSSRVAEVFHSLTSVLGASEQNCVGSFGSNQSELVKGQALASVSNNSCPGGISESKSADFQSWSSQHSGIVSDGAN